MLETEKAVFYVHIFIKVLPKNQAIPHAQGIKSFQFGESYELMQNILTL
jgi:hypothetical protein